MSGTDIHLPLSNYFLLNMIISTMTTDAAQKALNANAMVLFVPNKPSMPNLILNDVMHTEFYDFVRTYFYARS